MKGHLHNGAPSKRISKELLDRLPPSDSAAERGVIASVLLDPGSLAEIGNLPTNAFLDPTNQSLWRAILAIAARGGRVDQVLVLAQLREQRADVEEHWPGVVASLVAEQPTACNARYYADILRNLAAQRQIILTAGNLLRDAYGGAPADQLLATADQQLAEIRGGTSAVGKVLTFHRLTCAELDAAEYQTEYLVEWLFVAGQPCIVAGQKKALKTSILLDLAIAFAMSGRFLGYFRVTRSVRVLVMTGESGLATIQETLRRIAAAAGYRLSDIGNLVISDQLPLAGNLEHHDALKRMLVEDEIEVLILDPAYLCIPAEGNEASLFAMGQLLRGLSELCQSVGVTLVLVHHTKRGVADPFAVPELEDIAWAGFQEFARQWLLIGRRERYEPGTGVHRLWMNAGGSAGHSSVFAVDIEEGAFNGTEPRQWQIAVSKAEDAKRDARERDQAEKEQKRREKQQSQFELDRKAVIEAAGNPIEGDTKSCIRDRSGVRTARFDSLFATLLRDGTLVSTKVKKGNRWFDGYRLKPDESDGLPVKKRKKPKKVDSATPNARETTEE